MIDSIPSYRNYTKAEVYNLSAEQVLEDWYVYRLEQDANRAMNKELQKIRDQEAGKIK